MTVAAVEIPFGDWTPDQPSFNNPGATEAKNVVPGLTSYGPMYDLGPFSNGLTGQSLGHVWAPDKNNVIYNFAGDASKLYSLVNGTTWTDASRLVGGVYNSAGWEFTKFGSRVIAANGANTLQFLDVDLASANFADLPNAPIARRIGTVRDFIVVGDLDAYGPNVIGWSGYNSSELWSLATGSLATQSDRQELFGRGGAVQRIVPGEYGVIFQEQSIYRMEYAGPPLVFQLDEVERNRGTPAPGSVCWTGTTVFYYGWDGFYLFDGLRSQSISANRVSNWFKQTADLNALDTMQGVVDRQNRLVIWAFRTSQAITYNNRLIIYNWAANKWSYVEVDVETLTEYTSPGFSLDALDTPLPGGIDTDSILVDSDAFSGGQLNVLGFNTAHESGTFSGAPLTATLETKEVGDGAQHRTILTGLRPMVEGTGATTIMVQTGSRNRLQDNVEWSAAKGLNALNGEASLRQNARYMRHRLTISGGFDHAIGVRPNQRASGGRR